MSERPKINWQFQDLHSANRTRDWVAFQKLEADICLFYHQQADYSFVMGDLYYGDVYSLPYWEMLGLEGLEDERMEFVQSGCLMILLAMCWEILDDSGYFLSPHLPLALEKVQVCQPVTPRVARLRQHVVDVLSHIVAMPPDLPAFEQEKAYAKFVNTSQWAHQEFVFGYFRRRSKEFVTNPYYGGRRAKWLARVRKFYSSFFPGRGAA